MNTENGNETLQSWSIEHQLKSFSTQWTLSISSGLRHAKSPTEILLQKVCWDAFVLKYGKNNLKTFSAYYYFQEESVSSYNDILNIHITIQIVSATVIGLNFLRFLFYTFYFEQWTLSKYSIWNCWVWILQWTYLLFGPKPAWCL